MTNKLLLLLLLLTLFLRQAHSQSQLTHFHSSEDDLSSLPEQFYEFEGKMYFAAASDNYGTELWVSEGTEQTTQLFKDINPGPGSSSPNNLLAWNNELYFIAEDGNGGQQLFKIDDSSDEPVILTNFMNQHIAKLTLAGDAIYFVLVELNVMQIWKSDGTKAGTTVVKDNIRTNSYNNSYQGSCNGLFFFEASPEGSNGTQLWRSDGRLEGTFPVTKVLEGNGAGYAQNGSGSANGGSSYLTQYIVLNDELYFVARSEELFGWYVNMGIMKTDGSVANTVPVKAIHNIYTNLIQFADVAELDGKLYFSFFDFRDNRFFIWETDGTAIGTTKVYDMRSYTFFNASNLLVDQGKLMFTSANRDGGSTSLISYDPGSSTSTALLELEPTTEKPKYGYYFWNTNLLYSLKPGQMLTGLNKAGALNPMEYYLVDVQKRSKESVPALDKGKSFFPYNGIHYFAGTAVATGTELWRTDGTAGNTNLLKNIYRGQDGMRVSGLLPINDNVLFEVGDVVGGRYTANRKIWYYDTNAGQTSPLSDVNTGGAIGALTGLVPFKGKAYFAATQSETGRELWSTDGTATGTRMVEDLAEGTASSQPNLLTNVQDEFLYFTATVNSLNYLMKTDGVTTTSVKSVGTNIYNTPYFITSIVAAGNKVFFRTGLDAQHLWVSDGTAGGTIELLSFSGLGNFTYSHGILYFTANKVYYDVPVLWKSDGTVAGTKPVFELGEVPFTNVKNLISFNDVLYFSAYTKASGNELWKSDGMAAGTGLLKDIAPGQFSGVSNPEFVIYKKQLYFSADDGTHGGELWRTDGRTENTIMVQDIAEKSYASKPHHFKLAGDMLYFSAITSSTGAELWRTDGAAVAQVADILPGANHSDPSNMMQLNGDLYFMANAPSEGRQLFRMESSVIAGIEDAVIENGVAVYPNPASEYITVQYTAGATIQVHVSISDMLGRIHKNNVDLKEGSIYIGDLPVGIYILMLQNGKERVAKRFVKRNN